MKLSKFSVTFFLVCIQIRLHFFISTALSFCAAFSSLTPNYARVHLQRTGFDLRAAGFVVCQAIRRTIDFVQFITEDSTQLSAS